MYADYENCVKEHTETIAVYNYLQTVASEFNKAVTHITEENEEANRVFEQTVGEIGGTPTEESSEGMQ